MKKKIFIQKIGISLNDVHINIASNLEYAQSERHNVDNIYRHTRRKKHLILSSCLLHKRNLIIIFHFISALNFINFYLNFKKKIISIPFC